MMSIEARLEALGIEMPAARTPAGNYLTAIVVGDLVFSSGQGSATPSGEAIVGHLGDDIDVETGYRAARACAINCLAAIRGAVGTLDALAGIVQVRGFVSAAPSFRDHPAVMNGASDLLVELFGDAGRHVRSAIGVSSLPRGYAVSVEVVARLRP
jgi:enamine deaminase RidA (YjgF/YER057c/UK114 family)